MLRAEGLLDGQRADQVIPWAVTVGLFSILLALNAAAIRSLEGGSGLGPWVQAAWRRRNGGIGEPVGGVDPAHASWSLVSEPILWLTRYVPPEAVFSAVQAAAIALAVVPLWRLARTEAHLRVGAAVVVIIALALAPAIHRTNLSAFHPEVIALPALLWAYLHARQSHWKRYGALVVLVVACRADLGLTVAVLGALLVSRGQRRAGTISVVGGLAWTVLATLVLRPSTPAEGITPAGEFVGRATGPLAVFPRLFTQPITEVGELLAEPSVLFLVVVLAPLLFLPLVATRKLLVAMPCLVLAIVADRAVQREAQRGVLDLSPAAAHVAPALSFVFVALVFALQRVGRESVTRVNVDRRVLLALLAGVTLFFVAEAPTSPYRQPWDWGSRDAAAGAMIEAADRVGADDVAVAVSPAATVLVAGRAELVELPPDPVDLTPARVAEIAREVDVVLLDTSDTRSSTVEPQWTGAERTGAVNHFRDWSFEVTYEGAGIYLLERT